MAKLSFPKNIFLAEARRLPTLFSLAGLFFSWSAIFIALVHDNFQLSFGLALFALIADALDGFIARRRHEESHFGRLLDGNIDIFIYLIYPAIVFIKFFNFVGSIAFVVIFLFLAAGAYRLARFSLLGYDASGKYALAYQGLPVYFSLLFVFIAICAMPFLGSAFEPIFLFLLFVFSFLMILSFPCPKPKNPLIILCFVGIIALAFLAIGLS